MNKVMILANNDVGLFKFRKELLERLLLEYEVHIVVPDGEFVPEMVQLGCVFHNVELQRRGTNPVRDLVLLAKYRSILDEIAPDVVLTYTIKPNIYGGIACAEKGIPYITNITGLGTAVENNGLLQVITTTLYKIALRRANKVFFQNVENLLFMKNRGIVGSNIDLLPGSGVNLKQYSFLPYPNSDSVDFFFVARVMKEKGIDQYLDAARYIREKYPFTRFHVCGSYDDDYEDILNTAVKAGDIIYHGLIKDMIPMYAMSCCTVHPTYYPEGMSNVLLESCATGRPIITTDRPGCKEIVDDGVNGFVCRERDSQDLIEKIEQFLALTSEERAAMGRAARSKVEREFDRNIVVEKYEREIRKYGRI